MKKGMDHTAVSATKAYLLDPLDLAKLSQREILLFCNFQQDSRYKD